MVPRLPQSQAPNTPVLVEEAKQKYRTLRTGIRVLGAIAACYFGFNALEVLAGQNTSISLGISLILKTFVELKVLGLLGLTAISIAWALAERALRHRKVEYMQDRIKSLEIIVDSRRTSSNLTIEGKTNPGDRGD